MASFDLHNNIAVAQLTDPATATADVTSNYVDLQGYESNAFLVAVGESGDTLSGSVKIDLIIEHSDDTVGANFAAVTDGDSVVVTGNAVQPSSGTLTSGIFATIDAAAEDDAVYRVSYVGDKRYVRIKADLTGTHTNGTPLAVLAVVGNPHNSPAAAPTSAAAS